MRAAWHERVGSARRSKVQVAQLVCPQPWNDSARLGQVVILMELILIHVKPRERELPRHGCTSSGLVRLTKVEGQL